MASLNGQTVASSYEQLLHVDRDGGGNTTTHVSVKDGDNGTTFGFTIATDALMMTSTNRLEFGDNASYIHQSADGVLDLVSDTEIELTATTIDINGAVDMASTLAVGDAVTFSKSTNGDYNTKIYNANAGSSTEANIYITNSSSAADGFFAGVGGTGFTTASGFVQDGAWIGSGTGAGGGLSLMTRANADMRFYTNGHTNLAMTIDSSQNVGIGNTVASTINSANSGGRLVVGDGSGNEGITIYSGNGGDEYGILYFADGTSGASTYQGWMAYIHDANALTLATSGSEKMRITSEGNMVIGRTSVLRAAGDGRTTFSIAGTGSADYAEIQLGNYGTSGNDQGLGFIGFHDGTSQNALIGCYRESGTGDANMRFFTSSSGGSVLERMRITSAGTVGINGTSPGARFYVLEASTNEAAGFFVSDNDSGVEALIVRADSSSGDRNLIKFFNGGSHVGTISYNGTTVTYGSASDRRAKKNIVDFNNGLSLLNQLEVKKFDWKIGQKNEVGIIAQDLEKIIPNVVVKGDDKEEVDTLWQVDYQRLVPYLIKAVQELSAKVEALENA